MGVSKTSDTHELVSHFHSNLPKIGIVHGGHEQPLRNFVQVARVAHSRSLGAFAVVLCDTSQVLIIEFAFVSVQTSMIRLSSARVFVLSIYASVGRQEVAWTVRESESTY